MCGGIDLPKLVGKSRLLAVDKLHGEEKTIFVWGVQILVEKISSRMSDGTMYTYIKFLTRS